MRKYFLKINGKNPPTAIFYENIAGIQPVVTSIISELKLEIPKDVSIMSVEHKRGLGENYYPNLTNVYVPVYEIGKTAAQVLIDTPNKKSINFFIVNPPYKNSTMHLLRNTLYCNYKS